MNITIKNDNTDEIIRMMDEAVDRALEAIGMHLEGEAKIELENNPRRVDTGLLRNSITHALYGKPAALNSYSADRADASGVRQGGTYSGNADKDGKCVYIGTNVEYAAYVHEGTQKMAPNRFLKNAIEHNKEQVKQIVQKELSH